MTKQNVEKTDFGFQKIPLSEKQSKVNAVFEDVAHNYDLMNDVMSLGLHRVWKEALITSLRLPKTDKPFSLLDLAGGTGDIAVRALKRGGSGLKVTVGDINKKMLLEGQNKHPTKAITWVEADAQYLPFEDESFDAVTIAFGIRNVPVRSLALNEIYRVLKPGGKFFCLEFSHVDVPVLDKIYDIYSFEIIPRMGEWVADEKEAYQYLVESIRRFPEPEVFLQDIQNASFSNASFERFTGGIVALHKATKA